jgi:hypothetical protein
MSSLAGVGALRSSALPESMFFGIAHSTDVARFLSPGILGSNISRTTASSVHENLSAAVLGGHMDSVLSLTYWSSIKHLNQSVLIAKLTSPRSFELFDSSDSPPVGIPNPDPLELVDSIDSTAFLISSLQHGNIHEHLCVLFEKLVRQILVLLFSKQLSAPLVNFEKPPCHHTSI